MAGEGTRSARIDVLRGVAILCVLLLHFSLTYRLADSALASVLPVGFTRALIDNGNYGVTIFFVVSGFLITSNNLARFGEPAQVRLRAFYALRFARIAPPVLLALLLIVPLGALHVASFDNLKDGQILDVLSWAPTILSVLTFWHNVLMERWGYFNYALNIYWSLSVEEVFYLIFPLACVLLRRRLMVCLLCTLAIAIAPLYRFQHRDDELYYLYGYLACFDAIAFGCLTAFAYRTLPWRGPSARAVRAGAALGLAVTYLLGFDGHEVFGFTMVALFTALLLPGAMEPSAARPRGPVRLLAWFGRHSYELYLFHIVVLGVMRELVPRTHLARSLKLPFFVLFVLCSAAVAALIARRFADPVNRWLRARVAVQPAA
jgi:peptidoglycan/LPS O-acetylase OafA/YrhL